MTNRPHKALPGARPVVTYPWRRARRTVVQLAIALSPLMPQIVKDFGLRSTGVVGGVLALAAVVTLAMANPAVEAVVRRRFRWLAATPVPMKRDGAP